MSASRSTTSQWSAESITNVPETRRAARPMPDAEKYLARQAERENPDFEYLNFGADLTPEELNGIVDDLLREIDQHAGSHDTAGDAA